MLARADSAPQRLVFQPDRFFLSETLGHGIVRAAGGKLVERCTIHTIGRWDHQFGAMHFDEVFTYDSGRVDTLNWAFSPDPQGRMAASEISVPGLVHGWNEPNGDYRLRFRRAGAEPVKGLTLTYDTRFTLMEPDLVLKSVRVGRFGLTLATMTGFHRQVG